MTMRIDKTFPCHCNATGVYTEVFKIQYKDPLNPTWTPVLSSSIGRELNFKMFVDIMIPGLPSAFGCMLINFELSNRCWVSLFFLVTDAEDVVVEVVSW